MKKLTVILVVSLVSIAAYSAPVSTWSASVYKGIVDLKVELGQQVKKGQLIFQVKHDILNIDKAVNTTSVKFLEKVLEGGEKLAKIHAISINDLQLCQRGLVVEQNILKSIDAQIADSMYYAPFDGTITKIKRYQGSGLGDNDDEIEITEGNVKVDTANQVALVCTRWAGVLDLKVGLGQKVKKGELLFSTNTNDLKAQLDKAKAKAKYDAIVHEREKSLYGKTTEHATSLYKYLLAKDTFNKQNAEVKKIELQITQCSMYAPFDGTVINIYRYTGSGNGQGKPVMDIKAFK
jgi:multidrug resistance efflux pump